MALKLACQRGVLYTIVLIPLSLLLFWLDPRSWGIALGITILVSTACHSRLELIGLPGAALTAYAAGYRIEFLTNPEGGFFYLQPWSWLITLAWIIAITQGVSVLGQLDSSGKLLVKILGISGGALALIALLQGQWLGVLLVIAVLVAAIGFQTSAVPLGRWSRALGYGLAIAALVGVVKTTASVALLAPLIALVLPFTSTLSIAYGYKLPPSRLDEFPRGRQGLVLLYLISASASILAFLVTRFALEVAAWAAGAAAMSIALLLWAGSCLSQTANTTKRFVLCGVPIDTLSLDEAVQRVESFLSARASALVCTPDTTAIVRAQRDRTLREIYERADLVTPDGIGIVWAGRVLGAPLRERVSGIDLLERLFARGRTLRLFLVGAAPGVAEQAAHRLLERYPNLRIVGTHHGYFQPHENEEILSLINQAQPDIVLVGLGVPKQELWMAENRAKLNVSVLMGVGGCFDVWAGRLKRAPHSWQHLGLEWLYRVLQEPKRLGRVSAIPVFVVQVLVLKSARWIWGD